LFCLFSVSVAPAARRHSGDPTITFETYIYWSGRIGERVAEALIERARAGRARARHARLRRLRGLTAITAAERCIDIEAAYFVPDRLMIRELIGARRRGVRHHGRSYRSVDGIFRSHPLLTPPGFSERPRKA
jgi:phosphatidylserine/phosphatidylglycerophosphate/cardiolipin synthase-like enzyme